MSEEIKINKHSGSITFTNNGISFSQFGIAKEILDLVDNQQQEIDRLNNIINQADNKNLELIQKINKIYDIIENKNITGIEARLLIQYILDKEYE